METCCDHSSEGSYGIDDRLFSRTPRRRHAPLSVNMKESLESTFFQPSTNIPLKLIERMQQRWPVQVRPGSLFDIDLPDIGTLTLYHRSGRHFQIVGYEEVSAPRDARAELLDAVNVVDVDALDPLHGSVSHRPTETIYNASVDSEEQWLRKSILARRYTTSETTASALDRLIPVGSVGLLVTAPGLQRGICFDDRLPPPQPKTSSTQSDHGRNYSRAKASETIQSDLRITAQSENHSEQESVPEKRDNLETRSRKESVASLEANITNDDIAFHSSQNVGNDGTNAISDGYNADVDELLPVEFPSLQSNKQIENGALSNRGRKEWAHVVDLSAKSSKYHSLLPGEMAREWPFELDRFQKEAIYHLECGDSVFVAAHTSAGKTVVAEYAIALAQKHHTKAIYTSPIKALSNQKFRDFKNTFDDVGILTGDVQINQEAKCLIMTTEILRSKLYSQSDLLREVEFVIFDEVHYVSDTERGVVWEEVIIMLPEQVSLILLSATVPNTYEFASWVGRTKRRDVYVITTPKRPVPLEHYLWSGKVIQKIVGADRKWIEKGYREAKLLASSAKPLPTPDTRSARGRGIFTARGGPNRGSRGVAQGGAVRGGSSARHENRGGGGPSRASHQPGHMGRGGRATGGASLAQEKTLWSDVVRYLRKSSLLPACIFVFSRMRCEEYAVSLANHDFCDTSEKTRIYALYSKAISRLSKEDQDLPQITRLRDMATRGIAVHHGGLLPIVKEIVELLFSQSLIKVLFATETFAVGLNLPTRTVVFSDYRKFDGTKRRFLSPGEYTQMAGRAGRRGLDSVGTAIIVPASDNHDMPPAETLKGLILGQPTRLTSQFRLTYNMILSLHRVKTLRVEDMMKRSFAENATQSGQVEREHRIKILESKLAAQVDGRSHCNFCSTTMGACHLAGQTYRQDTIQMHLKLIGQPGFGAALFSKGRLIVFRNRFGVRAMGFLAEGSVSNPTSDSGTPLLDVIEILPPHSSPDESDDLPFVPSLRPFFRIATPQQDASKYCFEFTQVPLDKIEHLANCTVTLGHTLEESLATIGSRLENIDLSWTSRIWDEIDAENIRDVDVVWYLDNRRAKANIIALSPALACPYFAQHYTLHHDEWVTRSRLADVRRTMDESNLVLLPEYQNRLAVLRHMDFMNDNSAVLLKGRVACEVRTADTLVLTEAILNNLLANLTSAEIASFLSIFVYQGKDDQELETAPVISNGLSASVTAVYRIWKDIVRTQEQFHVLSVGDESEYASRLHFGLMEVVYEWASGSPFKTIAGMTTEQEGTIVRTITRLEETCREVRNIGRIIGDTVLEAKMNGVREAIMRNVTTVPSLYL